MSSNTHSELWKKLPWKKLRKNLFRLQVRLYKAARAGNRKLVLRLQRLILRSFSARMLAIRQVTQLNKGKKTAGVDGKKSLNFKERMELESLLRLKVFQWKHDRLREIPIPKKDGTRILKIPTIADRAWQCLVKLAVEPAHEATFHKNSYGFRPGRSTHDCQKMIFDNLSDKKKNGSNKNKRVLELDIEKCFDRINHNTLMELTVAPQNIKIGLWKCLKVGVNPDFPEQGTPQGGVISPLLANIALNGIEDIHPSIRYADDMVFFLKPKDDAEKLLCLITNFLANRGLNVKVSKTKLVNSTDGFDFLGWNFFVQKNGKFKSIPSEENFKAFQKKVKKIVNNPSYGANTKATKLAPVVRGWRNYHRFCKMEGSRFSLWHMSHRTFKVFLKEKKTNRHKAEALVNQAFPEVGYSENAFVKVAGDVSPYNNDIVYWSKRESKLYDGIIARQLVKQQHKCGHCGLEFMPGEDIHLHHIDGNHNNWKTKNLIVVHQSCHQYIHMA